MTVQKHWQSNSGAQRADRAVQMLYAMSAITQQLPGSLLTRSDSLGAVLSLLLLG